MKLLLYGVWWIPGHDGFFTRDGLTPIPSLKNPFRHEESAERAWTWRVPKNPPLRWSWVAGFRLELSGKATEEIENWFSHDVSSGWWFGTRLFLPIILGMSSSQLTNSIIFQRGGEKPPTSGPGKLARNFFSPLCQVPGWYGEMTKGWGRWLDGADDGLDDNDDRLMNDYDWICKLYYIIIIINLS